MKRQRGLSSPTASMLRAKDFLCPPESIVSPARIFTNLSF